MKYEKLVEIVDKLSPYALTGSVFAEDRFIRLYNKELVNAAGNFYIKISQPGCLWASSHSVVPGHRHK
jgi:1-pyrroline-5-carboxylate dehydrogenase